MLEGYFDWVQRTGADTSEVVLHVEPQLSAEFDEVRGDLIILTGKPDLIVRDVLSDAITLVDTKTVQSLTQVQNHAGQGLTYALLAKAQLDLDVTLFRTNQARKVKRTSTAKPPFFGRAEMVVTPKHLETHRNHLLGQLEAQQGGGGGNAAAQQLLLMQAAVCCRLKEEQQGGAGGTGGFRFQCCCCQCLPPASVVTPLMMMLRGTHA
jgi:hypothetical protein